MNSPVMNGVGYAAAGEAFKPRSDLTDESIHSFISRRFSPYVAETLIDAVTSGIYAGDIQKLSMRSCFGRLFDMEKEHGSVVRGMLAEGITKQTSAFRSAAGARLTHPMNDSKYKELLLYNAQNEDASSEFVKQASRATSVSFRGGMQELPNELLRQLEADPNIHIIQGKKVRHILPGVGDNVDISGADFDSTGHVSEQLLARLWGHSKGTAEGAAGRVEGGDASANSSSGPFGGKVVLEDGRVISADHVFSTLPAKDLAPTLGQGLPVQVRLGGQQDKSSSAGAMRAERAMRHHEVLSALGSIEYATVGVVNLGYDANVNRYDGFGHLVPSKEKEGILGVTWDSSTWPDQGPIVGSDPLLPGGCLISCMYGLQELAFRTYACPHAAHTLPSHLLHQYLHQQPVEVNGWDLAGLAG
jgi:oxygen-dependent protoporphyrinogen oxidase